MYIYNSLGQVHKAKLRKTNETVAIKIQRPFLRELYDKDLTLMKKLATMGDTISSKLQSMNKNSNASTIQQNFTEIFLDARTILYREIDYEKEAENTIRFANDFGIGFGGLPVETTNATTTNGNSNNQKQVLLPSAASWIRVPQVYKQYSTKKVLVMEYVPSIKINNYKEFKKANISSSDQIYIANCLARSYFRQFCNHLFFSTDPHPGNLGVETFIDKDTNTTKPRLVFYDFGQACELSQEQGIGILNVIESIMDMDAKSCVQSFKQMGVLKDDPDMDLDLIQKKVQYNFDTGKIKVNNQKKNNASATNNSDQIITKKTQEVKDKEVMQYFQLPAEYAFVARAITQMDGVGKGLDENFDFISSSAPYIVEIKGADVYLKDVIYKKYFSKILKKQKDIVRDFGFFDYLEEKE